MTKEMKRKLSSLFLEVFHFLLGYAVTILTLQCFLFGFEIPFRQNILLIGAFVIHVASYFWLKQKAGWKSLLCRSGLALVVLLLLLFPVRDYVFSGFSTIWKEVSRAFIRYYGGVAPAGIIRSTRAQVSAAMLVLCLPVSLAINAVLFRNAPRLLFAAASLLIAAFPFFAGLTGSYRNLLYYIACALPIMAVGVNRMLAVRKSLRFFVFVVSSVCMLLIVHFFPLKAYEAIDNDRIKEKIQDTFEGMENELYQKLFHDQEDSAICAGGLNHGELGWVDEVHYSNREALKITIPEKVREDQAYSLFFRSYIGEKYESNYFTTPDRKARREKDVLDKKYGCDLGELGSNYIAGFGLFGKVDFATIRVENIWAGQDYYIPYYCKDAIDETRDGKLAFLTDVPDTVYNTVSYYQANDLLREYLGSGSLESSGTFAANRLAAERESDTQKRREKSTQFEKMELAYRKYVKQYDLEIPKGVCDKTVELFHTKAVEQLGATLADCSTEENYCFRYGTESSVTDEKYLRECTSCILEYLFSHTEYSLSPGKVPARTDLIDYFLFENQKGFCAYYAAAATIAFRAMGIPARYVEGFKAAESDFERAAQAPNQMLSFTLKDVNAHAWVEIYIDGFGWYPVEVTPGFTEGFSDQSLDGSLYEQTPTPQPSEEPSETPSEEPSQAPEPSEKPEQEKKEDTPQQGTDGTLTEDPEVPFGEEETPPASMEDSSGKDQTKASSGNFMHTFRLVFCWLLAAVLVFLAVFLLLTKRQRAIRRAFREKNRSLRVQKLYPFLEQKLLKDCQRSLTAKEAGVIKGLPELFEKTDCVFMIRGQSVELALTIQRIVELAQKAAFSGRELSEEEWSEFRRIFHSLQ